MHFITIHPSEMIKAVIVEDEKHSQELLHELVKEYCEGVEIVGLAGTVAEALQIITETEPTLVFLDIELPDGDGFQVLEKLDSPKFDVIFTTAYDQYAMRAFKFAATDYLLKPIDNEELEQAVARVVEKQKATPGDGKADQLQALIRNIRNIGTPFKRIVLPTTNGFTVVNPEDIIRCESDRNYTFIFLKDGRRILVSRTIKEYDEMLTEFNFFRIHQSHLINLNFLKNYTRGRGGYVELTDGTVLDVSARRKSEFLAKMGGTSPE